SPTCLRRARGRRPSRGRPSTGPAWGGRPAPGSAQPARDVATRLCDRRTDGRPRGLAGLRDRGGGRPRRAVPGRSGPGACPGGGGVAVTPEPTFEESMKALEENVEALARGLVVFLDGDRPGRLVRQREVREVLAHREQLVLRVSERREERLAGAGQELDVLPGVRRLVAFEELRDAHLPLRVAGSGVHQDVPHGFARLDGEASFLQLLQGRRGRRQDEVLRQGAGYALREDELVDRDRAVEDALRGPAED